jgi:hypothetical protein
LGTPDWGLRDEMGDDNKTKMQRLGAKRYLAILTDKADTMPREDLELSVEASVSLYDHF